MHLCDTQHNFEVFKSCCDNAIWWLQVDIYSFGVLLWELVTATPPIRGRLRPVKVRLVTFLFGQHVVLNFPAQIA